MEVETLMIFQRNLQDVIDNHKMNCQYHFDTKKHTCYIPTKDVVLHMQNQFRIADQISNQLLGRSKMNQKFLSKFNPYNAMRDSDPEEDKIDSLSVSQHDRLVTEEENQSSNPMQRLNTELEFFDSYIDYSDPHYVLKEYNHVKSFLYDNSIKIHPCSSCDTEDKSS